MADIRERIREQDRAALGELIREVDDLGGKILRLGNSLSKTRRNRQAAAKLEALFWSLEQVKNALEAADRRAFFELRELAEEQHELTEGAPLT